MPIRHVGWGCLVKPIPLAGAVGPRPGEDDIGPGFCSLPLAHDSQLRHALLLLSRRRKCGAQLPSGWASTAAAVLAPLASADSGVLLRTTFPALPALVLGCHWQLPLDMYDLL